MIEFENVFPLPLPLEGVEAEQGQTAAAPLLFRGLPIAWVSVAKTKTVLCRNAPLTATTIQEMLKIEII